MDIVKAIEEGDLERVRALLAQEPSLAGARDGEGVSVVLAARYRDRTDIVEELLAADPELDVFGAAGVEDVGRLEELLDADPSLVNAWSPDGFTPLHLAAFFGNAEAVRALLADGADVTPASRNGLAVTPLQSAVAGRDVSCVRALLEAGADANAREPNGFTPLHAAAQNGDEDIARLLLERGADPGSRAGTGATPAEMAREAGHDEVAALLEV